MINKFSHWLSHLFGTNIGKVATWHDGEFIYVGFICDGCGKLDEKTVDRVEYNRVVREIEMVDEK